MAADQGIIDVDKTYDPNGEVTLDEHRQIELAKIEQPGFGTQPQAAAAALPGTTPQPQDE